MMKCGHAAIAVTEINGERIPACPICCPDPRSYEIDTKYAVEPGRMARCSDCGKEVPSNVNLPFFKRLGPGSPGIICKNCHLVHTGSCPTHYKRWTKDGWVDGDPIPYSRRKKWEGKSYEPDYKEYDEYYCGCNGWN